MAISLSLEIREELICESRGWEGGHLGKREHNKVKVGWGPQVANTVGTPGQAGPGVRISVFSGIMNWFKIGKGIHQGVILSPCLFNLYAEYIMQNATLGEAQDYLEKYQ